MSATLTLPTTRRLGDAMPALDAAALSVGAVPILVRGVRDRAHLRTLMALVRRLRGVEDATLLGFEAVHDALLSVRVGRPTALAGELRRHLGRRVASCATVGGRIEIALVGAGAEPRATAAPWRSLAVAEAHPAPRRIDARPAPLRIDARAAQPRIEDHPSPSRVAHRPARWTTDGATTPRPDTVEAIRESVLAGEVLAGRSDGYDVRRTVAGPGGAPVEVEVRVTAVRDPSGRCTGFVARALGS